MRHSSSLPRPDCVLGFNQFSRAVCRLGSAYAGRVRCRGVLLSLCRFTESILGVISSSLTWINVDVQEIRWK